MVETERTWEDELLERVEAACWDVVENIRIAGLTYKAEVEAVGWDVVENIRIAGLTYQAEVKNCLEAYRDTVKDIINDYNEE